MLSLNPISFGILFSFSFISKHFLSFFLFHFFNSWFNRILFNFHIFVNLLIFLLLLTSCFILLWLDKMLRIISASLNLLYFELTYSLSWRSPMCTWEICVFCYWCWGVLYFSVVSIWFTVLFKFSIFLFIFCLDFLFTIKNGLLKTLLKLFPLCRLYVYLWNCCCMHICLSLLYLLHQLTLLSIYNVFTSH